MPKFYKSIIIADIMYNNSKLSKYLIKAANESKLLNTSIEQIQNEISNSRSLDVSEIKQVIEKIREEERKEIMERLSKSNSKLSEAEKEELIRTELLMRLRAIGAPEPTKTITRTLQELIKAKFPEVYNPNVWTLKSTQE
ncbi:MAG: hypothetical protein RMJ51_03400 [Candidatus Calescibacterium sp.]|nr:hypothetical protein [Candidatus Calescibacterium sp.]MCX7971665.1 hypothetical protein [bacterium]MDW8195271.1 hypothetical protein [Candidatus Calescibacterium sp.]